MEGDPKKINHLYAILFREAKLILSNYEKYLQDKLTSKELAQKSNVKLIDGYKLKNLSKFI